MTTRYPAYAYKHAVLDSTQVSTFDDIQTMGMFDGEGVCLIQRKFSLELSSNEGMTALRTAVEKTSDFTNTTLIDISNYDSEWDTTVTIDLYDRRPATREETAATIDAIKRDEELSRQRKKSQESAEVQKARKLLEKKGYRVEK